MAYAKRRRGHQVTVYYWDRAADKTLPLPRALTRHLDGQDDAAIRRWVDDWEAEHGREVARGLRHSLRSTDAILLLHAAHLTEWFTLNPVRGGEARRSRELRFEKYILPYFVTQHGSKNLKYWHRLTPDFPLHLLTLTTITPRTAKRICQELANFGSYLARRQYIAGPWLIDAPKVNEAPVTPLQAPISPETAFAVAAVLPPKWALVVLLGYFASLRPEETYALEKGDILAGDMARMRAKTHTRFKAMGLGSGLSVDVNKAKARGKGAGLPKTHYSVAVVNVWDTKAAQIIANIVRGLPDGPIYPLGRDRLNQTYRKEVKPIAKFTPAELRSASALYLGRTLGIEPFLLQDHLRHSSLQTTLLYTRDPKTRHEAAGPQNFDDVG